jgi:hypothetical protein
MNGYFKLFCFDFGDDVRLGTTCLQIISSLRRKKPARRLDVDFWVGNDFFHDPVVFVASCLSLSY